MRKTPLDKLTAFYTLLERMEMSALGYATKPRHSRRSKLAAAVAELIKRHAKRCRRQTSSALNRLGVQIISRWNVSQVDFQHYSSSYS